GVGGRGKSAASSEPVAVAVSIVRTLSSAVFNLTKVPGSPLSSRRSSVASTQSPGPNPSTSSRPTVVTVSVSVSLSSHGTTTDPFSSENVNEAYPNQPPPRQSTTYRLL